MTERFVAFQEARDALTSAVLRGEVVGEAGEQLLRTYRERRREFIEYTQATTAKWPLAFYPINYDDWLRNDPTFAATYQLAAAEAGAAGGRGRRTDDGGRRVVDGKRTTEDGGLRVTEDSLGADDPSSAIRHLPSVIRPLSAFPSSELLPNGTLAGPLRPARRMSGLPFSLELPAPWNSESEPTEHGEAEMRTEDGGRSLNSQPSTLNSELGLAPSALLGSSSDRPPVKTNSVRIFEQEDKPRKGRDPITAATEHRPPGEYGRRTTEDGGRRTEDGGQTAEVGGRSFNSQPSTLNSEPGLAPPRYLHLAGQTTVTMAQWVPAKAGATYVVSASVRGRVSPSNIVTLSMGWMDAKQKRIGNAIVMRLPVGAWPDWVRMMQGAPAPEGAAWLGIGFRVEYQLPGDWADVGDFSVKETLRR